MSKHPLNLMPLYSPKRWLGLDTYWFRYMLAERGITACLKVGVDSQDVLSVIQAVDGSLGTDRCPMGEDGPALPWQADRSRAGRQEHRLFIEAVLWIARRGSRWRDLQVHFGNWSTAFRRFRDWRAADVFKRIFDACSDEPDMEYAMVDATIVKVHRHGQGAKGGFRASPSVVPKEA